MLGNNGGRIGSLNAPRSGYSPSGIYLANEQTLAKRVGQWPIGPNEAPAIGEAFGGGFFAGYISHTADGSATHALIVSPRSAASGAGYTITTTYQTKTSTTDTPGTYSTFDGVANTDAMVAAGIANHPAANYCKNLTTNGYTDWYLPARFELEIAYYNLKPSTFNNSTSGGNNPYSVPPRNFAYTLATPPRTVATAFIEGNSEAFSTSRRHWTSTRVDSYAFKVLDLLEGAPADLWGTDLFNVRAFRRVAL